jgi:hypothetical protein
MMVVNLVVNLPEELCGLKLKKPNLQSRHLPRGSHLFVEMTVDLPEQQFVHRSIVTILFLFYSSHQGS